MIRILIPALLLAACMPSTPPPDPAGASVSHLGVVYPIEATAYGWQLQSKGQRVICRAPTTDDCYWSLRGHLTAEARLADIP
ncbi:hypothetical protein GVY41_11905 [Frigidibacter albus]|uniref:Uncharacterized protein n=1 Tax=Frigidibacter albus TaxID=1465486 RepID=A0A6L8VJE6_9RHOB|nr:hypothetical protein [Frigidibacter albus]MZQ89921.1 hypothetical protein [Frigidibacter albus]NBE31704.1 hypothetical protein [Frigidibacter albus]GGH55981.1 hypothetical protein GCM10011341_24010 [Frigidibacter albus]